MRKRVNNKLPKDVKIKTCYTGKRSSSFFQTKDKTRKEHEHDLVYHAKCPNEECTDDYIGEIARRIAERVKDHRGRDHSSHLFKHSLEKDHTEVELNDFKIIARNYKNNNRKRKVSEALLIKRYRPTLNKQDQSIPLKLLN